MRIAFSCNPALGHLLPLLPLATAAREAGHEVAFLGGSSLEGPTVRAGFRRAPAGPPDLPTAFEQVPERAGLTGRRLAAMTWERVFGGVIAPEMAAGLMGLAREWRPDLLVHDDSELGSWIGAERLGIPHVSLQATAWRGTGIRLASSPLGRLRASLGLSEDPGLERWHRNGYLTTRPAALWNPDDPMPATTIPLRPVAQDELSDDAPAGFAREPGSPSRVAVTLGTMLPGRLDAMTAILDGLERLDVEVVATVGPGLDPAALGPRPARIHVERYVPMSQLLPTCDALVFHAGSGTMLAALAAGLPLVLLPVAADQPENADRCVAAGVGIALAPDERAAADIERATRALLGEPAWRGAAARARDEIAAMPAPAEVLPALEALAATGADGRLGG
ncbi:MAG TPA: nucleotide disphospho-sugar-binding domain-containing protein [Candidatus Limnocylindrales bacterium]